MTVSSLYSRGILWVCMHGGYALTLYDISSFLLVPKSHPWRCCFIMLVGVICWRAIQNMYWRLSQCSNLASYVYVICVITVIALFGVASNVRVPVYLSLKLHLKQCGVQTVYEYLTAIVMFLLYFSFLVQIANLIPSKMARSFVMILSVLSIHVCTGMDNHQIWTSEPLTLDNQILASLRMP